DTELGLGGGGAFELQLVDEPFARKGHEVQVLLGLLSCLVLPVDSQSVNGELRIGGLEPFELELFDQSFAAERSEPELALRGPDRILPGSCQGGASCRSDLGARG